MQHVLEVLSTKLFSQLMDRLDDEGQEMLILYSWLDKAPGMTPEERKRAISHALKFLSQQDN